MSATPEAINKAIEDHYALWWTDEMKADILRDVGLEGLAQIQEISTVANDSDIWIYSSNEQAFAKVDKVLRERYPFLSAKAISRLSTSAAYGWK